MNTTIVDTIGQMLQRLPRQGVHREVALQRLTDMYAAGESIGALRAAAERARNAQNPGDPDSEVVADVLTAASELWDGSGVPIIDGEDGGPRDRLSRGVSSLAFAAVLPRWIAELRRVANGRPASGACTVATAMQLWHWTLTHVLETWSSGDAPIVELAEAFCGLAAARAQILEAAGATDSVPSAHQAFLNDLCHVQAARSAGAVATACVELVFGFRRHPSWDAEGCASCYNAADLDELEGFIPGIASGAHGHADVIEADGSHAPKAGPCAKRDGLERFVQLRAKLDGCLTGVRLTKQRAAAALPQILTDTLSPSTY
jgi:hypothetical protein